MKLGCYEKVPVRKGISVYRLAERDLPLQVVLAQSLVCAGPGSDTHSVHPDDSRFRTATFAVRGVEGLSEPFRGFIAYADDHEVADFLREEVCVHGESPRGPSLPTTGFLAPIPTQRNRSFWSPRTPRRDLPAFFVDEDYLDHRGFKTMDRNTLFRTVSEGQVLVLDRTLDYEGRPIPRRHFAAPLGLGADERALSWHDGVGYGLASSLRTLPPSLGLDLDEAGTSMEGGVRQILPGPDYQGLFLLRAPSRAEAGKLRQAREGLLPLRRTDPFYLIDTREPVAIPRGLPIIEDPEEALAILLRAPDGIYLPEELPRKHDLLTDQPGWFLAARLGA